MRPRLIEVTNFLGHVHERVVLPDQGMFFLTGPSGAGKSSLVVDAMGYALFGARGTRTTQQKLRHKDHAGEPMEVRVLLQFDDQTRLTVARGVSAKGTAWAELHQPDPADPSASVLVAEGASRVGREVRKRLGGMSPQQFYAAFVARQKDISMLTELRGKERRDTVHRMLGMRELEKAAEDVAGRLRGARTQLKGLQAQLGERTRHSEDERVAELTDAALRARKRADSAAVVLGELQAELDALTAKLSPLRDAADATATVERLTTSLRSRELARDELRKAVARHEHAVATAGQLADLQGDVDELEALVERLRGEHRRSVEHAQLTVELDQARQDAEAARVAMSEPHGDGALATRLMTVADIGARRQVLQAELERVADERSERAGELERLRDSGECFTCLRPLGAPHDHDVVLGALEAKLTSLDAARERAADELGELDEDLPRAQERERAHAAALAALTAADARADQFAARLAALRQDGVPDAGPDELLVAGKDAAGRLRDARQLLAGAQAAGGQQDPGAQGRLDDLQALIDTEAAQLADATGLAAGAVSGQELAGLLAAEQALRSRVDNGTGQVPELGRHADSAKQAADAAQRERDALIDKLDRLADVHAQTLALEDLQTYLQGFQRKLAADIRPVLEEMSAEMLNQVSGGNHVSLRLNEDYEIEVQTAEGSWLEAELLSGGEDTRVNICLRLALTRLVSQRTGVPVRMLVLDEPLPAQDPGHIAHIMELLSSLRPFYPQIFIVSHVGDLRSADEIDYLMEFSGARGASDRVSLCHA